MEWNPCLAERHVHRGTDMATTITSISLESKKKEIAHYGVGCHAGEPELDNAPEALCQLEQLIDDLANTGPLVHGTD